MAFSMVSFLMVLHVLIVSSENLLGNGDFEASVNLGTYWSKAACAWSISTTETYNGSSQSVYISNRTARWAGIRQSIDNITAGHVYAFIGYIKLENLVPGFQFHEVQVFLKETFSDDSVKYSAISRETRARPGSWIEVGGDFKVSQNVTKIQPYIQIEESGVNYFFDEASLEELQPDPEWRSKALADIESLRKARFDILVKNKKKLDLSNYTMELTQTRSDFPHGTAVKASYWTDPTYAHYKDFVYNTLKSEWAVIENALKWRQMEFTEGNIKFDDADATINDLLDHGVTVRGHNVFWGVQERIPNWVQAITDKDVMLDKIKTRINGTIDLTRGRLAHWDVNNEALHDDFFESRTENPDITKDMFSLVHAAEPGVELFLNDFSIINRPQFTTALKVQAKSFLDSNTPIHGIGVQGHFGSSDIDITQLKYRLDRIAEVGLPIWVTELSVTETDAALKAQALEDVLTVFFSHPSVKGVLIWGFWTEAIYNVDNSLAEGTNPITLNAAGQKYVDLVNTVWRTNWTRKLAKYRKKNYFKGDYTLRIKHNGATVKSIDFNVPAKKSLSIKVKGTNDSPKFKLRTK